MIPKSVSLKYEPSSEPLHISAKWLLLNADGDSEGLEAPHRKQAQRNPDGEPLHFDPRTLDAISMSLMVRKYTLTPEPNKPLICQGLFNLQRV